MKGTQRKYADIHHYVSLAWGISKTDLTFSFQISV